MSDHDSIMHCVVLSNQLDELQRQVNIMVGLTTGNLKFDMRQQRPNKEEFPDRGLRVILTATKKMCACNEKGLCTMQRRSWFWMPEQDVSAIDDVATRFCSTIAATRPSSGLPPTFAT